MLSHDELIPYSRHLILPEIGLAGQERLKATRVLLVGAGGLGSPAAPLARLRELDGHAEVLVSCHHGTCSRQAVELLRAAGFAKVRSVREGIDAWAAEVDPRLTRY